MNQILHYLPYVFLFAAATALIYGWGLWRAMRQKQDLSNLLSSKGVSAIRRATSGSMSSVMWDCRRFAGSCL